MTFTQKYFALITLTVLAIGLMVFAFLAAVHQAYGASTQVPGITLHTMNQPDGYQDLYTFFSATTTTATSTNAATAQDPGFLRLAGVQDVIFFFSRGDTKGTGNSGSSVFKVQVTPDGTTWVDYNELGQITVSPTADMFETRVGTTTISAATSTVMYAMEDISYLGVRCITVRTTDGEATCKAVAQY